MLISPTIAELTARMSKRRRAASTTQARRTRVHPHQKSAGSHIDSVFVVKSETRSGDTGHPLVKEPTIALWEGYRTKDDARVAMVEIANRTAAFEIARTGSRPSPAFLNVLPSADDMIDSIEVLSAEGMIYRFFIDRLPIVR